MEKDNYKMKKINSIEEIWNGVDRFKTRYTKEMGYCLTATI